MNAKYFECYGLSGMNKAVLNWMKAAYTLDEEKNVLTLDEKTAEILLDILQGTPAEDATDELETETNFYKFAMTHRDAIEESLEKLAESCGDNNGLEIIYNFNWNNANRYSAREFKPLYTVFEIARAYYREEDELHIELMETLAAYALEETARLLDCTEIENA